MISSHPDQDVLGNEREGLLPHPYQAIKLLPLLQPPQTSQMNKAHHNYHVTSTTETCTEINSATVKPQPSFHLSPSQFSPPSP